MSLTHAMRKRVARFVAFSGLFLLLVASSVYGWWSWESLRGMVEDDDVLSVNTDPSSSLGEEVWRMRLRRMHRRQERLQNDDGFGDRPSLPVEGVPVLMNGSSSSTPPRLVSSGVDMRWVLLLFLALYAGVLHERARRRV